MRRVDHLRITEAVVAHYSANVASIDDAIVERLKNACVEPDQWMSRRPHHRGREVDIARFAERARKHFLCGEIRMSAELLGVAFHFICDGTCPDSSDRGYHNRWERDVSSVQVGRLFPRTLMAADVLCRSLAHEARSPRASVSLAARLCAEVLEVVWRPLDRRLQDEEALIDKARARMPGVHARVFAIALVALSVALPMALAISLASGWYLLGVPVLLGTTSIYWKPVSDRYEESRPIMDWYKPHGGKLRDVGE